MKTSTRTLAIGAIVLSMFCAGCTDAEVSRVMSYGDPQHVRFYSGGMLVGEWTSTGQVVERHDRLARLVEPHGHATVTGRVAA